MLTSETTRQLDKLTETMLDDMARAMVEQNAEGGCTRETLIEAGFSPDFVDSHQAEARRRANAIFVRREDAPSPRPEREARRASNDDLIDVAAKRLVKKFAGSLRAELRRACLKPTRNNMLQLATRVAQQVA